MNTHAASPLDTLRQSNAGLRRFTLDNGIVCLVKEERSAPVVAVQFWIGSGSIHEEAQLGAGLAHYLEHMAFKGTPTRGATQITKEIDEAGGDVNAYTTLDRTVFFCDLPSRHWQTGVDVLADAVLNASLPEDEWAREKEVILREFAMGRDEPDRELQQMTWATAFRVHPYREPVIGHEDIFRTMTRDDLAAFHRRHYVTDNLVAVVVGDIDANAVEKHLRATLGPVPRRPRAPVQLPTEPPQLAPRAARKTGAYELGRLQLAWHTVGLSHPDAPALDVLAHIVGQGRSSRLVADLQEKRKLVYDISAWSFTPKDPGLFGATAAFDPAREADVLAAIEAQVADWQQGSFTEAELAKAKRGMLVSELGSLQTASGQANSYGSGEFYAADPLFGEAYLRRVESVTASDLVAVAHTYLRPENRTLVVLAPTGTAAAAASAPAAAAPAMTRVALSNGAPLIVREDHRLPFVHVVAVLGGGLLEETERDNGITQLQADLLTRGTPTRDAESIAREVEQLGASLQPFAGRNSFGLMGQCLTADAPALLDLFADCLLRASFPEEELEKQKQLQLAQLQQQREQPMYHAQEQLRALLYPGHPYRLNLMGSEAGIAAVGRADLQARHARQLRASNIVVAIFGDVDAAGARALADRSLGAIPAGAVAASVRPPAAPVLPARRESRQPREQAVVLLGWPAVSLKDPRYDAVQTIARALSGLSADLGIEIREKRGLVYYVGASAQPALEGGHLAMYAGTRDDAAAEVEQLMRAEAQRLAREGLRDEEWKRAAEQLKASFDMSLQNNGEFAQLCALNELYGLGYEHALRLPQRLDALTGADIRAAAAQIFRPEREAVSVVRPAAQEDKSR